ncbi:putative chaperone protein dnaJ 10-like [Capsicum annuum]|nr:putative chaperone protein dnaJ 10-like [Capsicum annuum]
MTVATTALTPNMILYLMNEYHMDMTTGSNIMFIWSAVTPFKEQCDDVVSVGSRDVSILADIGDSPSKPPPCVNICRSADMLQFIFLCFSLGIIAIGVVTIRSSSLAFGFDQLKQEVCQENARAMERYFTCIKIDWKPAYFSTKERIGFGLLLSFLSVSLVATVEGVRRSIAIKESYSDDPQGVIPMSAMWVLPQNFIAGIALA